MKNIQNQDEKSRLKLNKSLEEDQINLLSKNIGLYSLGIYIDYKGKTLGQGTFGKVKLGIHKLTNEKVAIKILEKQKIVERGIRDRVEREILILKKLHHINLIRLYEIIETNTALYMVMEYVSGGELFQYINHRRRLAEREAVKFFQQLICGLDYLHKLNISHRDLKPENLLLDDNKTVKIVDFGLSNFIEDGQMLKTPCGSPCYAAPEMISGKRYSGVISDLWSVGIILYVMLCGYLPFDEENNNLLYKKILNGHYEIPLYITDKAKDLIKKLLTVDPNKRINIKQIKEHPWFNIINFKQIDGLFMTKHIVPVDEYILSKLVEFNMDKYQAKSDLQNNKHSNNTCTYYLLLSKHVKRGYTSVSDLFSKEFQDYLNNSKSLIKSKPNVEPIKDFEIKRSESSDKKSNENKINDIKKEDKNKIKEEYTNEEKIFKKINIVKVINTSRNANKNIFHHNITYNKVSTYSDKQGDLKCLMERKVNLHRKFINTSTNYESSTDEKNFSNVENSYIHQNENNKLKEKPKSKFTVRNKMNNFTYHNSNNSKSSFQVIKETEENDKSIRSRENFTPIILKKDKNNLTQKPSLNSKKMRNYFFSNSVSRNEYTNSILSPNLSSHNSMMEKSAKITRKNSKLKAPNFGKTRNIVNNNIKQQQRDTSEPCSYTGLNTSIFATNNMITKDSNHNKWSENRTKNITNYSLMLKKTSISNNYSSKLNKTSKNFMKKEVKVQPILHISPYLNDKMKKTEKKSKKPSLDKVNKEISPEDIKIYRGPFDLSCCQEKSPRDIRDLLLYILNILKVRYTLKGFTIHCLYDKNKFSIEINKLENLPNVNIIRFIKLNEDFKLFNEVCRKILTFINHQ